ncbi:D-Ala-D-Ala carboxypeptidase family metallohydrolase [Enterobacter asburiae]|uniref:D-Ala-D-Ala carboxypeptidase family metallohydrolase n=1 Tax=Enterobacter asburiae TaxID=61645 RepID=UPI00210E36BA|nr:D-Ala-D-Ala carboxypeptidase family metallohydrolase [Enterobacter asburiae]MCQ4370005.1 D-Ala-D-Ala carboxypeptidase family metallohydrolase [Enterobacter asburiae]
MMGDLSKHFSRSEFACRCGCGFDRISPELITVLEDVRTHFGAPVKINSGCRCEKHNAKVGGVPNSQHVQGIAADIVVSGRTPALVAEYLERKYPDRYGVGRYSNFTHIDVRQVKARWRG